VLIERLISKAYADERRGLIDPARALPWDRVPSHHSLSGDTVFIRGGMRINWVLKDRTATQALSGE
jgi:hypothetical protein